MTSLERVSTSIQFKEPDRVPLFLPLSAYGAKELGISIKDYFSDPKNVAKAQIRMRKKYDSDFYFTLFYAAVEVEAWGGGAIFNKEGSPNAKRPFIRKFEDIKNLVIPKVKESPSLLKVLQATQMIKDIAGDEAPIVGVIVSPFSLPIMQLGFDKYIDLIYEQPELFNILMKANQQFSIEWANAQIESGATLISYFDPMSSPTIIPRELYLKTGYKIAKQTIANIKGPTATSFASGRSLSILEDVAKTGTAAITAIETEDITEVKKLAYGKLNVIGNLNGIEMRHWTEKQAEEKVKDLIARAGSGGGFILSDHHGEIPWQVPEEVLKSISKAVNTWGKYPLDWVKDYEYKQ